MWLWIIHESEVGTYSPSHHIYKLPLLTLHFSLAFFWFEGGPPSQPAPSCVGLQWWPQGCSRHTPGGPTALCLWASVLHLAASTGNTPLRGGGEMGSTINNDSSVELVGLVTNAWTLLCGNMYGTLKLTALVALCSHLLHSQLLTEPSCDETP